MEKEGVVSREKEEERRRERAKTLKREGIKREGLFLSCLVPPESPLLYGEAPRRRKKYVSLFLRPSLISTPTGSNADKREKK